MAVDSALIDEIVRGVLTQLAGGVSARTDAKPPATPERVGQNVGGSAGEEVRIGDRVITAELLAERLDTATHVTVAPKAIVTPAAWDLVRERGVTIQRGETQLQASAGHRDATDATSRAARLPSLLIVVRHTPAVERLCEDLHATWRRELLGCPDDAAQLAISAIARGETNTVTILAAQTHRAACLANRNDAVKAVAVRDAADVPVVRKQLRANVWCVDPTEKSWFQLRSLVRAIEL